MARYKTRYKINNFFRDNISIIVIFVVCSLLFVYSVSHICIYLFGQERELYVETEHDANLDFYSRIWYNNGKKMVHRPVHLSFIELRQIRKNSGFLMFKQLGTQVSHRSAFVYSTIYSIVFIFTSTWIIIGIVNKKKNDKLQVKNKE